MRIRPIGTKAAAQWIRTHHRHHLPSAGCKFALALHDGDRCCGVAVAGRPVNRHLDDGLTLEVLRVATDGTPNACSELYGAVVRVAWAMGYDRLITYTLPEEGGGQPAGCRVGLRRGDEGREVGAGGSAAFAGADGGGGEYGRGQVQVDQAAGLTGPPRSTGFLVARTKIPQRG